MTTAIARVGYVICVPQSPENRDPHVTTPLASASQYAQEGARLHQAGRIAEAIAAYQASLRLKPDSPVTQCNLGIAFIALKKNDDAANAFRAATQLKPDFVEAFNNLGGALRLAGRIDEAIAAYQATIRLSPNYAEAHCNLGRAFCEKGRIDEAIAEQTIAIRLAPNDASAYFSMGNALSLQGRHEAAIDAYRKTIALKPDHPGVHNYLALSLRNLNRLEDALPMHRIGMAAKPDDPDAHCNYALTLLLSGNLTQGWREYESRSKCTTFQSPFVQRNKPLWDGSFLDGKTILIHPEQGLGDTIQFIRYAPIVAQFGGRVIVECQPPLLRLAKKIPGVAQWVPRGEQLPPFDVHCPMLSLPLALWTTLDTVPAATPYLHPDQDQVEKWAQKLGPKTQPLRVGLVWRGNPGHKNDTNRSLGAGMLEPLAQIAGIEFVSLQKSEANSAPPAPGVKLTDYTADITDFADTAALIANLDVVLSVDTSVAHLAGALGRPVWTLLPFAPDWRWMLKREDSPWYPSMRLFRQATAGNWSEVIERVGVALGEWRDGTRG